MDTTLQNGTNMTWGTTRIENLRKMSTNLIALNKFTISVVLCLYLICYLYKKTLFEFGFCIPMYHQRLPEIKIYIYSNTHYTMRLNNRGTSTCSTLHANDQ
jgi:hypothetical protein